MHWILGWLAYQVDDTIILTEIADVLMDGLVEMSWIGGCLEKKGN